jgi:O-antigen ligase
MEKALCFILYTIPGFLMAYAIIGKNPKRLKHLMSAIFIFSVLVLCETYRVFLVNGLSSITNVLNTNYLVTGQTLGAGLLVLLSYFYFRWNEKNTIAISGHVLLSGLFFYALINLGGRGPVIAAGSAAIIFYGMQCWLNTSLKPGLQLGILALFCSLLVFTFNGLFDHADSHFYQRIAPLLSGQIDEAVNERFIYYQSAFSVILEHPFIGVGFGGWPISTGLGDISLHPHNIFLEILSETGFIGFALFVTFLYFVFRDLKLTSLLSTPERTSLALLTIFSLINAQKTGDLHDNLLMFVTLALCAALKKDSP